MISSIAMRRALLVALAGAATAQAQPVMAALVEPMGFVPHRALLVAGRSADESAEALYLGDRLQPLPIFLPVPMPASMPMTVEPTHAVTGLPRLYSLISDDDEPVMEHARRSSEERNPSRHPRRNGRHIDIGEDGEHGSQGNVGGGTTPVPLPPALPLLGSVLAALLLVGASTRRS